jgi:hypothetical protein
MGCKFYNKHVKKLVDTALRMDRSEAERRNLMMHRIMLKYCTATNAHRYADVTVKTVSHYEDTQKYSMKIDF